MMMGFHHIHVLWPGMFLLFGLGRLFLLILLGLLVWAVVRKFAMRNAPRTTPPWTGYAPGTLPTQPNQPSALEILRQRYARGEIDSETFEHMRERLEASQRPND